MGDGDRVIVGPVRADDPTAIAAAFAGKGVVVADNITAHVIGGNVVYTIIKAA